MKNNKIGKMKEHQRAVLEIIMNNPVFSFLSSQVNFEDTCKGFLEVAKVIERMIMSFLGAKSCIVLFKVINSLFGPFRSL